MATLLILIPPLLFIVAPVVYLTKYPRFREKFAAAVPTAVTVFPPTPVNAVAVTPNGFHHSCGRVTNAGWNVSFATLPPPPDWSVTQFGLPFARIPFITCPLVQF
jgi:hypothetical protein